MDDINLASNNTKTQKKVKTGRKAWQYLFDIIIKTILCSAVISINFTLFANAGSYNLFSSATYGNLEAIYIYAAITSLSFVLILIASFIRPLENIVLSAVFALFAVAVINQFGLFEKQSGLLLLFDGLFSEDINIILYEHSHMITALIVFVIFWIILSLLSRSFIFYLTLGACAILGWLISEAYLNPEVKYFKEVAGLPNLKKENMGKNVIFLSFNDLTSINNLKNMNNDKQPNEYLSKTYNNIVGFYNTNNFTLYPNALVEHPDDAFANLVLSYNAKNLDVSAEDNILSSSAKEEYFDFKSLQQNKIQLKNNPLYDMLRKNDYKINVFQTRDIDTCYVNNKLSVSSCIEKINSPILLNGEKFTTFDKLVVLISQWLESTGMVNSINPLLKTLEYAGSLIPSEFAPKSVELGKVYSYNAITIFDKLLDTIDKLSGNQAYFAIIDLPSNNYVYDEFCKLKPLNKWVSAKNIAYTNVGLNNRKEAYAEQLNCLYGNLEKFIQQLDTMGQLENTTIVIQGLNNPVELMGKNAEFYKQIQTKRQVTLAIKQASNNQADINYSVCSVPEIINSVFFDKKDCKNFAILKTSDKNTETAKKSVNEDKLKEITVKNASASFNEWFALWSEANDFEAKDTSKAPQNKIIEKASVMNNIIEDTPESKMKSISVAEEETKEVDVDNIKEVVADKVDVEVPKPSKIEELAQKTYDEISAKVNEVIKNKEENKKENLINRINDTTKELSADIDKTFKNVADKVVDAFDNMEKETTSADEIIENKEDVKEDIVARTKKAIKEKEEKLIKEINPEDNIDIGVAIQSKELKDILEAPVADGQNLSPEELKKMYHQKLKNAVKTNNLQVEIIEE